MSRVMAYSYANSRVKAMKSELLDKSIIEEIVKADNIAEIIGILERTYYREDLAHYSLDYSGANLVELALGKNLASTSRKVVRLTPEVGRNTLLNILEEWDIHNLKTIILAKSLGHENILPFLVPAANLTEREINRLLEQKDIDELLSFLTGTKYGKAIAPNIEEYRKSKDVAVLLNALDQYYYDKLMKGIKATYSDENAILDLMKERIDIKNIVNILRAKKEGIENIRDFIIRGGKMKTGEIDDMIASKDVEGVIAKIKDRYDLGKELEKYQKDGSIAHFENRLERIVVERVLRRMKCSTLSLSVIVGYLLLKEEEISNIRKIVRGKEFNLPEEELREMMVI